MMLNLNYVINSVCFAYKRVCVRCFNVTNPRRAVVAWFVFTIATVCVFCGWGFCFSLSLILITVMCAAVYTILLY